MNGIGKAVVLGGVVLGAYVLASSLYTVSEVEQMIITQFGKPVDCATNAVRSRGWTTSWAARPAMRSPNTS